MQIETDKVLDALRADYPWNEYAERHGNIFIVDAYEGRFVANIGDIYIHDGYYMANGFHIASVPKKHQSH